MIVRSIADIPKTANIIAFDTETTSLNPRTGQIIGYSVSDYKNSYYVVHQEWENGKLVEVVPKADCIAHLETLLSKKIYMFNAYFDVTYTKNYFGVDLVNALHADAQLMNHTLDENLGGGLKFLAQIFLGANSADEQAELKAHLKAIGAGPNEFYKADTAIIGKYAAQDARLTYKLGQLFEGRLVKSGSLQELFYDEIMPLQRTVVIPMQQRGIKVDLPLLQETQQSMSADMQVFHDSIITTIKPLLDEFYDRYFAKKYPLKSRGKVFSAMKSGMSLRQAQEYCAKQDGNGETFNILSKHHLKDLFFEILKLEPLSRTELGAPQVDDEFLESVEQEHTWVKDLRLYNKLTKVKSSYVDRILEEQEDGIFYPAYQMHRTTTGRLAGDFQQLPRQLESGHPILLKYNNRIRSFFVARPGKIFIDSDYESLEPHIFSHLAGDEVLLNIFRTGVDFYSQVAIATEGLTEYSADKSAPNYLGKVNKTARQMAKSYSLGIRYGLDDYKLHKDLGISQQSAQRLVKQYFESFPKLAKSMEDAKNSILNTGRVSNMFGRVRRNPEIPPLYRKYGNSILNALDLWKKFNETPGLYKQAKVDYKTVRAGINNAYNFEVQSTAAHIVNRASIEIAKAFNELGLDAAIIGQCHDEVLIECDESIKEQVAAIMQDKMENTVKLSIDLPAIPQYGYRYSEVK